MKISKRTIIIIVGIIALLVAAYYMFFKKKSGDSHPSMKGWSEDKKKIFKAWVFEKANAWKLSQATSGNWEDIHIQADEWGMELEPAIARHTEWEYDNGRLIEAYISTEWWINYWSAYKMKNGLDENGF